MSGFLTKAQIRELTGLSDKAEQIAWLRKNGVRHFVNAADKIKVTWGAVDGLTGEQPKAWCPDFSAIAGA